MNLVTFLIKQKNHLIMETSMDNLDREILNEIQWTLKLNQCQKWKDYQ